MSGKDPALGIALLLALLYPAALAPAGCPSADVTADCEVDLEDLAIIGTEWLNEYDSNDVITLADQWLERGIPTEPCGMVWVSIDDPGVSGYEPFNGEMSKYETTNAQYCWFLNAALVTGDIVVDGNNVEGAYGSNIGEDFGGEVYYELDGTGFNFGGATNGGAARINYSDGSFDVDDGFDEHPVTHVTLYGATAFCNYYGYRLPTEWEWQAVADYDGSYNYGCGPSINSSIANYDKTTHPDGTTAVGSFGAYGYGMCDMAGNVWEWTTSCYHTSCFITDWRVPKGGCWFCEDFRCTVSRRNRGGPTGASGGLGFRVCR